MDPTPFPLWLGDDVFCRGLSALIEGPRLHPERYHRHALPVRRLAAVFGNRGAFKSQVITALCKQIDPTLPVVTVTVHNAIDPIAREDIDNVLLTKVVGPPPNDDDNDHPDPINAVIIINHAQYMAHDPHVLTWKRKAVAANVIIVACLDHPVLDNPAFGTLFSKSLLYLPPPSTSALRIAQMRWHFAHYQRLCPAAGLVVEITDDEWQALADEFTKLASQRHLKQYVQRLIIDALQANPPTPITYYMATSSTYITSAGGDGQHIVPRSLTTEENSFASAARRGPMYIVPPIQHGPPGMSKNKRQRNAKAEETPTPLQGSITPSAGFGVVPPPQAAGQEDHTNRSDHTNCVKMEME